MSTPYRMNPAACGGGAGANCQAGKSGAGCGPLNVQRGPITYSSQSTESAKLRDEVASLQAQLKVAVKGLEALRDSRESGIYTTRTAMITLDEINKMKGE